VLKKLVAIAVSHHENMKATCSAAACAAVALDWSRRKGIKKPGGRFLRSGSLSFDPKESFWKNVDEKGDDMEFFHFTSFSREAFQELVDLCTPIVNSLPLRKGAKTPSAQQLRKRMYQPRDIIAMTLKYLLSQSEQKNLNIQFGAIASVYSNCVTLGLQAIVTSLINNEKAQVFWDRSRENLESCAALTRKFLDLPNVVGMIDGKKLTSLHPRDEMEQNRDWNGWTNDVHRSMVLIWDPKGKIIDAAINLPGNFHDSKASMYGRLYNHIEKLPDPFCIVADSAFQSVGSLKEKVRKLDENKYGKTKTDEEKALTHLRQGSEWGNHTLGCFRRLKNRLPTDNDARAILQWSCILLHNFRTETCDRNQIKTYFEYINMEEEEDPQSVVLVQQESTSISSITTESVT
jgi:hypothetical protein